MSDHDLNVTQEEFDRANIKKTPPPEPGTYELGLVLAGTVSAGGYTAGFIDFLTEALDAYEARGLNNDPATPLKPHKVLLKVIAGASGGGMVAGQAGRALFRDFKPVTMASTDDQAAENLLFSNWVNGVDIDHLANTSDLDGVREFGELNSILNATRITELADESVGYLAGEANFRKRGWVSDTLDVIMTHFNMRGVPYRIPFAVIGGQVRYQKFREHADHLRFQIRTQASTADKRPDAIQISAEEDQYPYLYARSAVGTAAFPGALHGQLLSRPVRHYLLRSQFVSSDGQGSEGRLARLEMDVDALVNAEIDRPDELYNYVVADGGLANNEPLELARTTLAGLLARNPRGAKDANRGVIMVAPLQSSASLPLDPPMDHQTSAHVPDLLLPLIDTMRRQMAFSTADLELAGSDDVYSRFLVVPTRTDNDGKFHIGEDAIACSGLAAFMGFLDRRYRLHDYHLGRRNAWKFLKDEFWLDAENEVFDDWEPPEKTRWQSPFMGSQFLPLVPLVGGLANDPGQPEWPSGGIEQREDVDLAIGNRLRAVLNIQPLKDVDGGWFSVSNALQEVGELIAEKKLMGKITEAIDSTLQAKGLD